MKAFCQVTYDRYEENDVAATLKSLGGNCGGGSEVIVTYQKVTGALMANSHPGSYCGQDAYSDMFVTEERRENILERLGCVSDADRAECGGGQRMPDKDNLSAVIDYGVRRLTPLECERLQGFPDGWTDIGEWVDSKGKKHKEADSPRYKALGNSICLPYWQVLARKIAAQYERDITVGSLFDGIGGFPLVFERVGAKAVWASEIEEFPIAVTKTRFPEEET